MPFLDTKQQRAAFLILLLGLGLGVALWPFTTGLIGGPVLFIVFAPIHRWLVARGMRPGLAAGLVVLLALVLIVVPGGSLIGLIASQAQDMAQGVIQSPLLEHLRGLHVGPYNVGAQLEALGARIVSGLGALLLDVVGTATRIALALTIAFFGLFFMLTGGTDLWEYFRPFIPFSEANAEALRERFRNVTASTLVGTGLTALMQGIGVGLGFWVTGLPNEVFWGVMTVILSILPVVGSGLVWGPGVAALALDKRYGSAIALGIWGLVVIGNIDNLVRPAVYRRYAKIHPFVTVIGAFAGIRYFGLLGLLIGPLAISYFFELIRMYRQEYVEGKKVAQ
jgi:predicted PurR-regulated permease PerM